MTPPPSPPATAAPTLWQTLRTLLPRRFRPSITPVRARRDDMRRAPSPAHVQAMLASLRIVLDEMGRPHRVEPFGDGSNVMIVIAEHEVDAFVALMTPIYARLHGRVPVDVLSGVSIQLYVEPDEAEPE